MSEEIGIFRSGIQRFRTGGIAIAALPLLLGVVLLLSGDQDPALEMILFSIILFFLVLWATHCANEVVEKLKAGREGRR